MPKFRIEAPDGRVFDVEGPEGSTAEQALAQVQATYKPQQSAPVEKPDNLGVLGNIGMGALKGAADIGSTILSPIDALTGTTDRRQRLVDFFKEQADPESLAFKGGELGADIAATAGVGGVLAKGAKALGGGSKLISALETGGFRLGSPAATTAGARVADAALRGGAGAAVGGASAGLIDPSSTGTGAVIGGALPGAVKAAGTAGAALANKVSPEVKALYDKAKALGIDIPADKLLNSRPVNALAASLEYVPFSGRTASGEKTLSQFNKAISKTFGQDSDNVAFSLKKADAVLGDKFEQTLSQNVVKLDQQLTDDLVATLDKARAELTEGEAKIIDNLSSSIFDKAKRVGDDLIVDGQAAYNIKKTLDRIGNRASNESFYARSLKNDLMGALERSLGPDKAAEFSQVRKQYGNMLDVEKIVGRGAEAGVSPAKLANMKGIKNQDLSDLADIAAQFLKTRESPHGAAQRVGLSALGGATLGSAGGLPMIAGGIAAGRAANTALNSNTIKSLLMNPGAVSGSLAGLERPTVRSLLYNSANRDSP